MSARQVAYAALLVAMLGTAMGCGADPESCPAPSARELSSPHATAQDVAQILQRSCALGGCHLSGPGAGGLVLGRASSAEDKTWRAALVDVPSRQRPSMALVAPGDPDRSWLVAKLSASFCGVPCDRALGCGGQMPPGAPLSELERATIITWIAEGAP